MSIAPKPPETSMPKMASHLDEPAAKALQQIQNETKSLRYTKLPNRVLAVDRQGICSKPPQKSTAQGTSERPRPNCPRVIPVPLVDRRRLPLEAGAGRRPRVGLNVESGSGLSPESVTRSDSYE